MQRFTYILQKAHGYPVYFLFGVTSLLQFRHPDYAYAYMLELGLSANMLTEDVMAWLSMN